MQLYEFVIGTQLGLLKRREPYSNNGNHCAVYFDILILKLMGYSTALLSTPKGRIIDYREWGKFCNFVVVCLGDGGGGWWLICWLGERFALGGLVGWRKLCICSKK